MNWYYIAGLLIIGTVFARKSLIRQFYGDELYEGSGLVEQKTNKKDNLEDFYKQYGEEYGIDWKLIKAVAIVESSENPASIGDAGKSFGLMQVQETVGRFYGVTKDLLLLPKENIKAGAAFLRDMINKYGIDGGIQAYNLGETKYRKGLKSPTYLSKVKKIWSKLTL